MNVKRVMCLNDRRISIVSGRIGRDEPPVVSAILLDQEPAIREQDCSLGIAEIDGDFGPGAEHDPRFQSLEGGTRRTGVA